MSRTESSGEHSAKAFGTGRMKVDQDQPLPRRPSTI